MNHLDRASRIARKPASLAAVAAVITVAAVLGFREDAAAEKPAGTAAGSALAVETTTVAAASWPTLVKASGVIAAREEVSVVAEVGNVRLTEVHVDVGDSVRKGQRIAQFDDEELRLQEAELVADVARTAAAWRSAQLQFDRSMRLHGDAALSDQDLEQLRARAEGAKAEAEASSARLGLKRLLKQRTQVVAPYAGVISARAAVVGTVATSGQQLFRVLRDNRLEWRAELTAAQLSQVRAGQRVDLLLPDGSTATGSVRRVAPTVDPQSRMGLAYVDLAPGSQARAGMYAAGSLNAGVTDALVLPASAIAVRDGRTTVAKLQHGEGTRRISMMAVAVGRRQGNAIEVLDTLRLGDEVVLSGAGLLGDGDVVRVVTANPKASTGLAGGRP